MKGRETGFSLIEVLLALVLLAFGLLAVAPLFVHGTWSAASSADLGAVAAHAVERLEVLRRTGFSSLPAGGSLTSNVTGFSDTSDPEVTVRWTTANNGTPTTLKTITVRAIASRRVVGLRKEVTITTYRGR